MYHLEDDPGLLRLIRIDNQLNLDEAVIWISIAEIAPSY
jgi:hypothetical protein